MFFLWSSRLLLDKVISCCGGFWILCFFYEFRNLHKISTWLYYNVVGVIATEHMFDFVYTKKPRKNHKPERKIELVFGVSAYRTNVLNLPFMTVSPPLRPIRAFFVNPRPAPHTPNFPKTANQIYKYSNLEFLKKIKKSTLRCRQRVLEESDHFKRPWSKGRGGNRLLRGTLLHQRKLINVIADLALHNPLRIKDRSVLSLCSKHFRKVCDQLALRVIRLTGASLLGGGRRRHIGLLRQIALIVEIRPHSLLRGQSLLAGVLQIRARDNNSLLNTRLVSKSITQISRVHSFLQV